MEQYRATVGEAPVPAWLAADDVLAAFGTERPVAQIRYRAFVREGIGMKSPWADVQAQIYLGDEQWIERVRDRVQSKPRPDGHPRAQREVGHSMVDVIRSVARGLPVDETAVRLGRGGTPRMIAAWLGCNDGQLPLTSIAAGLRLRSAGHVSTLIQRCDRRLSENEALRASLDRCREILYQMWKTSEPKL